MNASTASIVADVSAYAFGRPLVTNVFRGVVVEAIVGSALGPEWTWCSTDYAPWDFLHADSGRKLEVKQSALRQSWHTECPSTPRWDIASRGGFWEGSTYTAKPGRQADIYVFGLHYVVDETADHRAPDQWRFFAVAAKNLPPTAKTIGLSSLRNRCVADVGFDGLGRAVKAILAAM